MTPVSSAPPTPQPAPLHPGSLHPDTLAVTSGRPERVADAPLNPPVVFASTYIGVHDPGPELGYGRYGNPTWLALEETIGALERGRALTFSSGMAAAYAALELMPDGGTIVLPQNCYLGVAGAVDERAARHGWTVRRVDIADTAAVLDASAGAAMVWVESPTNPMMEVADLPALGAALPDETTMVVDNTFATPLLQQPLTTGADVVLHSGTKFMSGHSDALLGALVVAGSDAARFQKLTGVRTLHGATPGTMEAYLTLRGIRTLPLRLERAQSSALVLAERLRDHAAVITVRFPGLPEDPGHERAAKTMAGFGSLLSVELADGPAAERFVDGTRLWVFATSLGSVESTFERRRRWKGESVTVAEGLVRLSVGVEHVEDLWSDLVQALPAQ